MKINQIIFAALFFAGCASCSAVGDFTVTNDDKIGSLDRNNELDAGTVNLSHYMPVSSLGLYDLFASKAQPGRALLVRKDRDQNLIPPGCWSIVDGLTARELRDIEVILEAVAKSKVEIDITNDQSRSSGFADDLPVLPKSNRKKFNSYAASKECIDYLASGSMPQRIFKRNNVYVLDCILPRMQDSGYLISISEDVRVVRVVGAEYYQYDRIPREND